MYPILHRRILLTKVFKFREKGVFILNDDCRPLLFQSVVNQALARLTFGEESGLLLGVACFCDLL